MNVFTLLRAGVLASACLWVSSALAAGIIMNRPTTPPPVARGTLDPPAHASQAFDGRFEDGARRPPASKPPSGRRIKGAIVQTQAVAGRGQRGQIGGRSAHALLRDPKLGSIGAYGSAMQKGAEDGRRVKLGVEGELFHGRYTVGGVAGGERARSSSSLIGEPNRIEEEEGRVLRPFSAVDARVYATPDMQLSMGHRYQGGVHMAAGGVRGYLHLSNDYALLAFLEGRIGKDYKAAWAGVHLVPGEAGTLLRHDRTRGTTNWLLQDFYGPRFNSQ